MPRDMTATTAVSTNAAGLAQGRPWGGTGFCQVSFKEPNYYMRQFVTTFSEAQEGVALGD